MKKSDKVSPVRKQKRLCFAADDDFFERLDAAARATKVSRSWLCRAVISGWLADKRLEP
jgi:predicted transcriptional regulator